MSNINIDAAMAAKKSLQDAIDNINIRITSKKTQIENLSAEIKKLHDLPVSFNDFKFYLRKHIKNRGADHLSSLQKRIIEIRPSSWGEKPANIFTLEGFEKNLFPLVGRASPFYWDQTKDIFTCLCYFFPEQIFEKLAETYAEENEDKWGNEELPSVADRKQRIEAMSKERASLEAEVQALEEQAAALIV